MKKIMFNDRYGLTEAVMQGRKTVTRRLPSPPRSSYGGLELLGDVLTTWDCNGNEMPINPPYKIGEIVAVAQSYGSLVTYNSDRCYPELTEKINDAYNLCCEHIGHLEELAGWNNKMYVKAELMPHQIRILDVRAERLQNITDEDCLREGVLLTHTWDSHDLDGNPIKRHLYGFTGYENIGMAREAFAVLIDKISGKGTWAHNPYVWRIEFELVK